MRSYVARTKTANSIPPASYSATHNGTGVDLHGFDSNVIVITTGVFGGAATAKIQDSVDNSSDCADSVLDGVTGNGSAFALTASSVKQIGYVGDRRYVRVVLVTSTTGNLVSSDVSRTDPKLVP